MKKLSVLICLSVLTSCAAFAADVNIEPAVGQPDITVKDMTSAEFFKNQGYSSENYRLIEMRGKNPLTPIPVEEKRDNPFVQGVKKVGWRFLDTLDPTIDNKNFGSHEIHYGQVNVEDL